MKRQQTRRGRSEVATAVAQAVEILEHRLVMTGEPHVIAGDFLDDTAPHRLRVQFDQDVSASLSTADLYVQQMDSDATRLPTSRFVLDGYDHTNNTATFHYNGVSNSHRFADGRYRLKLYKDDITNSAAQALAADWSMDFAFVYGDVNRDLTLNQDDADYVAEAVALAGKNGRPNSTLTDGDVNYDTVVNQADADAIADPAGFHGLPVLDQFATTLTVFQKSDGTRELHWVDDCAYELGYRIQVSEDGRTFTTLVSQTAANASSYLDTITDPEVTPTYRIRAVLPSNLAAAHVSGYGVERSATSGNGLATPPALEGGVWVQHDQAAARAFGPGSRRSVTRCRDDLEGAHPQHHDSRSRTS